MVLISKDKNKREIECTKAVETENMRMVLDHTCRDIEVEEVEETEEVQEDIINMEITKNKNTMIIEEIEEDNTDLMLLEEEASEETEEVETEEWREE